MKSSHWGSASPSGMPSLSRLATPPWYSVTAPSPTTWPRMTKYGPSCLVLGFTTAKRPLHVQCSYPSTPIVKVITLYEPDPSRWLEFKVRRREDG